MLRNIHLKNCRAELEGLCSIIAPSLKAIKEVIENDSVDSDRNTLINNLITYYSDKDQTEDDFGLDSGDRDILNDMLGRKFGGGSWPRCSDILEVYEKFIGKFNTNARAAGWRITC